MNTVSENGHKREENNGNENAEAAVESNEVAVEDQTGGEGAKEVPSEELNVDQPTAEGEEKVIGQENKPEGKANAIPVSENVPLEGEETIATEDAGGDLENHSDSGTRSGSRRIEIPNNKVMSCTLFVFCCFAFLSQLFLILNTVKNLIKLVYCLIFHSCF